MSKIKRNLKGQFTSEGMKGLNNPKWLGDKVGYFGLHSWIIRVLGYPKKCEICGSIKNLRWANKSKEYKRDLSDWIGLCDICHRKFDNITKLSYEQAQEIKNRYKFGKILQRILAERFHVDQSTISNIINNKIQYYV